MDHWSIPRDRASEGTTSSGCSTPAKRLGHLRVAGVWRRAGRKWAAYGVVAALITCVLLWSAMTPGLMLRLAGLLFGALFVVLTIVTGKAD